MHVWKLALMLILVFSNVSVSTAQDNTDCAPDFTSRLEVGRAARVTPGEPNNVRAMPESSSERIGQIPGEGEFMVLDGPVCADGFVWWQVDYAGLIGWTVEGNATSYWTEPLTPTPLPTIGLTPTIKPTATHTPTPTPTPTLEPFPMERAVITIDNARQLKLVARLSPSCEVPGEMLFDTTGERIALVCGSTVTIWAVEAQMIQHQFEMAGVLGEIAFSPTDPLLFATASYTGTTPAGVVELWNLDNGERIQQGRFDTGVVDMTFSPDGTQLLIAQSDDAIRILNVESFVVTSALSHSDLHLLRFIDDGEHLLAVDENGARIWNWSTGQLLHTFTYPGMISSFENGLVVSGNMLVYGDLKSTENEYWASVMFVRDTSSGSILASSPAILEPDDNVLIYNVKLSPVVSGLVAWTDSRPTLNLWNYEADRDVVEIDLLSFMDPDALRTEPNGLQVRGFDRPRQLEISPDGTLIAFAGVEIEILAVRRSVP